ncbi:hypothetical protein HYX16_05195 [Candidatus Woesearchaeota archaeon]|nr:hypothetical protein [Candidatus Woesearchaeota archaeon]
MIINAVKISIKAKIKIHHKHGITMDEIEKSLLQNKSYFAKAKDGRFVAIGKWNRCITVIFDYAEKYKEATIITAYPSSKWQIKLFKRKVK